MNNNNQDYQQHNNKRNFPARKQQQNGDVSVYGMIPPQATDLEAAVLGAVLLEKSKLMEVMDLIPHEDCFYDPKHALIYRAIQQQEHAGRVIDILTITEALSKSGDLETAGGAFYLTSLTMNVVSSAHVEDHARIVMEKHMLRELISTGNQLVKNAYDCDDVFNLMDYAEMKVTEISSGSVKHNYKSGRELAHAARQHLREAATRPTGLTGIDTGYYLMNHFTNGWAKGALIIVAARPSVGKTAWALNIALNATRVGKSVGLFSLEMGSEELSGRLLCAMSGVDHRVYLTGKLNPNEQTLMDRALLEYASLPIHVDDNSSLTALELRSKARKMKRKHDVGMIIVDYLQLMEGGRNEKSGNREQVISSISRSLKRLAKELDIPVIALSQLSREVEKRPGGEPQLSDLRESGAIEQDADMVMFLHGPKVGEQNEHGQIIQETDIPRFIKIAKNRHGSIATVELSFNAAIQKFIDKDESGGYSNPNAGFQNARQNIHNWEDNPF